MVAFKLICDCCGKECDLSYDITNLIGPQGLDGTLSLIIDSGDLVIRCSECGNNIILISN